MRTILKGIFKWYEDVQQTEDLTKSIFAMINGLIIAVVVIFLFKSFFIFSEMQDKIDYLEADRSFLVSYVRNNDEIIKSLKEKDASNQSFTSNLYDLFEKNKRDQQLWNSARDQLSNESVHLYIEEILNNFKESEGE